MLKELMIGAGAICSATAASAQLANGSEIVGQTVQVRTDGVLNTVEFQSNGIAQIRSASGATVVNGTWTANANQLCIRTASTFDCYPYQVPFQAGQPVDLVSVCGVRSQWTALSTVAPPPPPPATVERG